MAAHGHRHDVEPSFRRADRSPSSWGLGDGQAIPWEYAPAPEARDIVTLKERYGLFIGGREVAGLGRRHVRHGQSGHGGDAWRSSRGPPRPTSTRRSAPRAAPRPARGARCPARNGPSTCSGSRGSSRSAAASSRSSNRWTRASRSRRVARRRRAARGGPLLVLRRLGRQARIRVPGPGRAAARRRRPDHPVELPAADAGLEDRPGPRRRQHASS